MRVVIDIEADGLLPFVSRIWCVCVLDAGTGEITTYTDRKSFVVASAAWDEIVFHNGVGYDGWALWKVWNIPFSVGPDTFNERPVKFIDTLVVSRTLWPDRPGGHGLKDWGDRLGFPKGLHEDWTQYSEAMKTYCEQDTRVTHKTLQELQNEHS